MSKQQQEVSCFISLVELEQRIFWLMHAQPAFAEPYYTRHIHKQQSIQTNIQSMKQYISRNNNNNNNNITYQTCRSLALADTWNHRSVFFLFGGSSGKWTSRNSNRSNSRGCVAIQSRHYYAGRCRWCSCEDTKSDTTCHHEEMPGYVEEEGKE